MILFQDEWILVISKPAGLLSIRDGYNPNLPTIQSVLEPKLGKLWMIHRLDKDTSGIMVLARTSEAHKNLDRQFAERKVRKIYYAICVGVPEWDEILIQSPLRVNGDRKHRTVVDFEHGKPAETHVRVISRYGFYTWVEVHPHSGYTHQIRTHLSSTGYPLLGDSLYRIPPNCAVIPPKAENLPAFPRVALHAYALTFSHPNSGEEITFTAPLPEDFSSLLKEKPEHPK
ncbi:RluA family pseudouridine synthase [Anaerolinea sp.]|uniref:RluA family pseudouridine synthase n=1 Tax=Anaerolinea sp. TaxID=1872519 RepID=UPI002ACDD727|nr:RluA family pseudouridine synthase [Anaerolinea sp.]